MLFDEPVETLCALLLFIVAYNSARNSRKLTRSALVAPKESPWMQLLNFGDAQSFLDLTGFSRDAFMRLERRLFTARERKGNAGRPLSLDFRGQLGLYLFFLNSKMQIKHLCLLFGIVPTTACKYIDAFIELVPRRLQHNRAARVKYPTQAEMVHYASLVQAREPLVDNIIGFVDGVSIPVQCSDDASMQNAAYNGYHHDTACNNVFAFAPTGKIIFAAINYPGSWHDSQVCHELIDWVIDNIGYFAFCVDQGFKRSGELYDKFVGPISAKMRRKLAVEVRELLLRKHGIYVSLRQASEWGMRALQGTFARLKSRLTSNKQKRRRIIASCVFLHNFRTEYVGLNQIATVFNPHYQQYINLDTYDRIARYYH